MGEPMRSITRGGQLAWVHEAAGASRGCFHTYDAFAPPGDSHPPRRLHVFLPAGCDAADRCPVVYLNDGHAAFFPGGLGEQSWDAAAALSRLIAAKAVRPMLVVAVCPVNRNREYTHAPWAGPDCCGLSAYADYLALVVKPFIDAHYRTLPQHSLLAGSSHGGLAAFLTGCLRPDAFGFVAALSPSFWVGVDDAAGFPRVLPSSVTLKGSRLLAEAGPTLADVRRRPAVYLDWGLVRSGGPHNQLIEERATARGREMAGLLEEFGYARGRDLFVREDPAGDHTERSWARRFPDVLCLFDSWCRQRR